MAYTVMAYTVMAYTVVACTVMAYIVMAFEGMRCAGELRGRIDDVGDTPSYIGHNHKAIITYRPYLCRPSCEARLTMWALPHHIGHMYI